MMIVRDAKRTDAERLVSIYDYYVRNTAITFDYETPSAEEFADHMKEIQKKYPFIVAEKDGVVLGYAYAGTFKDREAYRFSVEVSIYLDREHVKRGYGKLLYQELEKRLSEKGIRNLYACIAYPETEDEYLTLNSPQFHEAMGYVTAGRFRRCGYKFGRWYDMIWMEKFIDQ